MNHFPLLPPSILVQSAADAVEQKQQFDAQLAKAQDDAVEQKVVFDTQLAKATADASDMKAAYDKVCALLGRKRTEGRMNRERDSGVGLVCLACPCHPPGTSVHHCSLHPRPQSRPLLHRRRRLMPSWPAGWHSCFDTLPRNTV